MAGPCLTHPFSHLNSPQLHSILHTSTQLISTHFLTLQGLHFGASWPPKSTQDRPKSPLVTSFFQKREFSRNLTFSNKKSPNMTPRRPLRRAKIAPRRTQDDPQEHLFLTLFLYSILGRLGSHFGSILAPLWAPKWRGAQGLAGSKINKIDPWRPMTTQDGSKTPQEPPKRHPRPPKAPKRLPRHPSDCQKRPKSTQDTRQTTKHRPQDPGDKRQQHGNRDMQYRYAVQLFNRHTQ